MPRLRAFIQEITLRCDVSGCCREHTATFRGRARVSDAQIEEETGWSIRYTTHSTRVRCPDHLNSEVTP